MMDAMPYEPRLMQAAPAAPAHQVTLANWRIEPFNRWAFSHVSEVVPSAIIAHQPDNVTPLAIAAEDFSRIACHTSDGRDSNVAAMLAETYTDGFLVLHKGKIATESYAGALTRTRPHIVFSVSKSITGSLAGSLVERGELDPDAPVTRYIPETRNSAYGDCTVRHVLDMTVAVDFAEEYLNPDSDFMRYRRATGWNPPLPNEDPDDLRSFLTGIKRAPGDHGHRFNYLSVNSDLLGWVLERASGKPLADLLSERIWTQIGAEQPAYITVDRLGAPRPAGGISASLRDLGRFGEMMRLGGTIKGKSIVPEIWVDDILTKGDKAAWARGDMQHFNPGGSYRSKWYILDDARAQFCAVGIHGQWIFIDRRAELVIVKISSQPLPVDEAMDKLIMAGLKAIAAELA
jgi:CubicO group peptidase (beta-lactamase class C family)